MNGMPSSAHLRRGIEAHTRDAPVRQPTRESCPRVPWGGDCAHATMGTHSYTVYGLFSMRDGITPRRPSPARYSFASTGPMREITCRDREQQQRVRGSSTSSNMCRRRPHRRETSSEEVDASSASRAADLPRDAPLLRPLLHILHTKPSKHHRPTTQERDALQTSLPDFDYGRYVGIQQTVQGVAERDDSLPGLQASKEHKLSHRMRLPVLFKICRAAVRNRQDLREGRITVNTPPLWTQGTHWTLSHQDGARTFGCT